MTFLLAPPAAGSSFRQAGRVGERREDILRECRGMVWPNEDVERRRHSLGKGDAQEVDAQGASRPT
jgi:hypothetical protein